MVRQSQQSFGVRANTSMTSPSFTIHPVLLHKRWDTNQSQCFYFVDTSCKIGILTHSGPLNYVYCCFYRLLFFVYALSITNKNNIIVYRLLNCYIHKTHMQRIKCFVLGYILTRGTIGSYNCLTVQRHANQTLIVFIFVICN